MLYIMLRQLASCDGQAHPVTAAPEPPASLVAGLFGRARVQYLPPWSFTHSALAASAELHQLEFRSDIIEVRVSPLQAAPDQAKFSLVTSVWVHIQVRALPIVLSESRYMTSVQQS